MSELNNILKIIHNSIAKLKNKPIGLANQEINSEDNSIKIYDIEIPDMKPEGKKIYKWSILNKIIDEWKDRFGNGRWNGIIITEDDIHGSDSCYFCMNMDFAIKVTETAYMISRKILDAIWTEQIFDCDDFFKLINGLVALILYKAGIRGCGAGIGMLKIDYHKGNKLVGHALNFLPLWNNNQIDLYLYEPQNTNIYKMIDPDIQIHFFDM